VSAASPDGAAPLRVLVGGVADSLQGDLDLGRQAALLLMREDLGPGVVVEELCFGAITVTQMLQERRPQKLVLVGAAARGRAPGTVERREVEPPRMEVLEAQDAIWSAGTGHVSIDLVVEVGAAFEALPPEVVAIEVEPASTWPSWQVLTPEAEAGLARALELVRAEVAREPVG
jgi:Ni,Fe-hydrogenase maturation factor